MLAANLAHTHTCAHARAHRCMHRCTHAYTCSMVRSFAIFSDRNGQICILENWGTLGLRFYLVFTTTTLLEYRHFHKRTLFLAVEILDDDRIQILQSLTVAEAEVRVPCFLTRALMTVLPANLSFYSRAMCLRRWCWRFTCAGTWPFSRCSYLQSATYERAETLSIYLFTLWAWVTVIVRAGRET